MQGERLGDHGGNRVMGELGGQGVEHVCTYMHHLVEVEGIFPTKPP